MLGFLKKIFAVKQNPYAGRTILVADDGEVERKFMGSILSGAGYRVLISHNGELAIKMAKEFTPDLVCLDLAMPGMSGRDVCASLKNDARTKNIPTIFLTGSGTPQNVVECYEAGAEHYLTKPISAAMLLKQISLTFQEFEANPQVS